MSSKYHLVPEHGPGDADDDVSELLLRENLVCNRKRWWYFLPHSALVTIALVIFPHPDEKQYLVTETGRGGHSWTRYLVYGGPGPEVDKAWYDLIKPFNTRVPAKRYEATMGNRTSVCLEDGSDNPDYYVTLTVYHELHCLMRFWRFLDPQFYANKTPEEQAQDKSALGHYKHCLWSLLESVLCNGDTSMRTFHWDPAKPAPKPDSLAERKCVNWDWLHSWTMNHSFLLQDELLIHPVFGKLDENLKPFGQNETRM
ncbi:hypothetical protein P885DRAFT_71491 [Corynascus similis CBS 632.67]